MAALGSIGSSRPVGQTALSLSGLYSGAIGIRGTLLPRVQRRARFYTGYSSNGDSLSSTEAGTFSGQCTNGVTPVAGARVFIYRRSTMVLIAVVVSDANGNFTFTGLQTGTSDYIVIAVPPSSVANVDAMIFDNVTPS